MLLNFNTLRTALTAPITEIRATGGGATSDVWLQIKADILNTNITALTCKEVGVAGTVALAGVAVGAFDSVKTAAEKMVRVRKVFNPTTKHTNTYKNLYKNYEKMYIAVKGLRE